MKKRLTKKQYYTAWEQFMDFIKKKTYNDVYVNENEFSQLREKLIYEVKISETLCHQDILEAIENCYGYRNSILTIDRLEHKRKRLQFLAENLEHFPEKITENDFIDTYHSTGSFPFVAFFLLVIIYIAIWFHKI